MDNDIFAYFMAAMAAHTKPLLLEFTHPVKKTRLSICGIRPRVILEVRSNTLFRNGAAVGPAIEIFEHLELTPGPGFFPAFLGFFSYEFARHFGKSCHESHPSFPEAYFALYDQGLVIDDQEVVHHDPLPESISHSHSASIPQSLRPSLTKQEFVHKVSHIKERIRAGDVYQVNLSLPFYFDASACEMLFIYQAMRFNNPSPFMGIVNHNDWWLLSGSPERLFSLHHGHITARPIAGTKKRGPSTVQDDLEVAALKSCAKENAEHAMLVDLMRNDLNQVAEPCTVAVTEDRTVEFYSHVMHLVSEVSARTSASLMEVMKALFPGGTITGAPKESVMKAIAELENQARGPYTGSLGYISAGFGIDFNIIIRSVLKDQERAWINTGAGIVIDSNEETEWQELARKAMALSDILANRAIKKPARPMIKGPKLKATSSLNLDNESSVFFLENHDSFSFNIIDALRTLGARVLVDSHLPSSLKQFSHVIIGPGPGNPESLPTLSQLIEHALKSKVPILGICLGHQAIGHYFGAGIRKIKEPVHGKSHQVFHYGQGLFFDLPSPTTFARYHSLAIDSAPKDFLVDAYTNDDCIMAIRHLKWPVFGVQFHPESYLSQNGDIILGNFLHRG